MAKNKNPWRGLASYEEPAQKNTEEYSFCGRDEEASQLVRLIDNSLFVTLYGRTGVGKTSLLRAGVFPALRLNGYVPLYIRLSHGATDKSYAEIIVNNIEESQEVRAERNGDRMLMNTDGESATYLWDYFCQTRFYNADGAEVYPVLVLDQFEEIFVSRDAGQKKKAELLMMQIHALLSDDYVLLDREQFSDETNYRFVASIREDNLFLLEDCIDENHLTVFKEDRYRLRPMKENQAKDAILIPGRKCIAEKDKDDLATQIINAAKDSDGTISSLLLSFICSQLYEKAASVSSVPMLDRKLFGEQQSESRRLLTDFYLQHTSKKQRSVIEEHYITEDGHRRQSQAEIPNSENLVNKYKILQTTKTESGDGLEIVHDRLAEVIYTHRRQRDSKQFRNLLGGIVAVILLLILGRAITLDWTNKTGKMFTCYQTYSPKTPKSHDPGLVLNDSIIDKYTSSSKVYIGENVDTIEKLTLRNGTELVVSPKNKKIKSDYIYYDGGQVQYLYYTDHPERAICMNQSLISWYYNTVRLPKGLASLQLGEDTLFSAPGVPPYGEECLTIDKPELYSYVRGDKRIKKVIISESCGELERGFQFRECTRLEEVVLPKVLEIRNNAFVGCVNLRKVVLPDSVYAYGDLRGCLQSMFNWCPNISEVSYSEHSHFHKAQDGIVYYQTETDTIPVIFTTCKKREWSSKDSKMEISRGTVLIYDPVYSSNLSQRIGETKWECVNVVPRLLKKGIKINDGSSSFFTDVCQEKNTKTLRLPSIKSHIPDEKNKNIKYRYIYLNSNPNLKAIHTPVANPEYFIFEHPYMESMGNVTLYVPYGKLKEYISHSSEFSEFKEIRQDSWLSTACYTVQDWIKGIKNVFSDSILLMLVTLAVLSILCYVFYELKLIQMNKQGVTLKKKAALHAIWASCAAVAGFVPVYWIVYVLTYQHYELSRWLMGAQMLLILLLYTWFVLRLIMENKKKWWVWLLLLVALAGIAFTIMIARKSNYDYYLQCVGLGSFCGGLSGYICAWLAAFAGNGKILGKVKRLKL